MKRLFVALHLRLQAVRRESSDDGEEAAVKKRRTEDGNNEETAAAVGVFFRSDFYPLFCTQIVFFPRALRTGYTQLCYFD